MTNHPNNKSKFVNVCKQQILPYDFYFPVTSPYTRYNSEILPLQQYKIVRNHKYTILELMFADKCDKCNRKLTAKPMISTFQRLMILALGEKFEVVAHQFLQHTGQVKEHPEIIKAGKQKPASVVVLSYDTR